MTLAPVPPGATLGFLGGGQLGRMTAMAARTMGYDVRVLDPERDCPARPVASATIAAKWDDAASAAQAISPRVAKTDEVRALLSKAGLEK